MLIPLMLRRVFLSLKCRREHTTMLIPLMLRRVSLSLKCRREHTTMLVGWTVRSVEKERIWKIPSVENAECVERVLNVKRFVNPEGGNPGHMWDI